MKIIEPSVTLLKKPEDQTNESEVLKYLERIGRVCYRSEDKITDGSARKFIVMLKKRKHWAMLEHFKFTVYCDSETAESVFRDQSIIQTPWHFIDVKKINPIGSLEHDYEDAERELKLIPLLRKALEDNVTVYRVVFSPRAYWEWYTKRREAYDEAMMNLRDPKFIERFDRFQYAIQKTWPTIFDQHEVTKEYDDVHEHIYIPNSRKFYDDLWFSIEFMTSRGEANEIVRHRMASYAQESTRYCNYSKDKFDNELTFIKMEFPELSEYSKTMNYDNMLMQIEAAYMTMTKNGVAAQMARAILPHALAAKLVMTTDLREWKHFFKLRCASDAHPNLQFLANKAKELIEKESGINSN